MVGIALKHLLISSLSAIVVFLLFVHMANLKPDVLLGEGMRWRVNNVLEALQRSLVSKIAGVEIIVGIYLKTLVIFLLLLVDYAQAEVDLVRLLEIRLHLHDLRKCFFGVVQRPVAVIQDADTIPKFRLLQRC